MTNLIETLKGGVVVSCQSEGDDPFNRSDYLAAFAQAAEMGGAAGIRAQGAENIKAIRSCTSLPLIGIIKGSYDDNWVLITPDFSDVKNILSSGADIVALDVTKRVRPNGMDGLTFLEHARQQFDVPLMADVATLEEGIRADELGADIVSTTLSGYTPYTESGAADGPDFDLIEQLSSEISAPVIAEGRIWTPEDAAHAIACGAYAVVIGTAITRPRLITRRFVDAVRNFSH